MDMSLFPPGDANRTFIDALIAEGVIGAARDFKYRPATFNGQPVKFRKLIQVSVKR